jgi:hypothetical protein
MLMASAGAPQLLISVCYDPSSALGSSPNVVSAQQHQPTGGYTVHPFVKPGYLRTRR